MPIVYVVICGMICANHYTHKRTNNTKISNAATHPTENLRIKLCKS